MAKNTKAIFEYLNQEFKDQNVSSDLKIMFLVPCSLVLWHRSLILIRFFFPDTRWSSFQSFLAVKAKKTFMFSITSRFFDISLVFLKIQFALENLRKFLIFWKFGYDGEKSNSESEFTELMCRNCPFNFQRNFKCILKKVSFSNSTL